jgi:hypothetical protein
LSVTFNLTTVPPEGDAGVNDTEATCNGATVTVVLLVVTPSVADTVTAVVLGAIPAVIVNVTVFEPAGTVTCAGRSSNDDELDSATTMPPAGAEPVRVTVPVPVRPLTIVVGLAETAESAGGVTVRFADLLTPGPDAVITTAVLALTGAVVTVNVALEEPAGIVTLPGTVAADELLDESAITRSPPSAALSRRTVPVDVFPPTTDVDDSVSEETSAACDRSGDNETIEAMRVRRSARCFICSVPWVSPKIGNGTCPFGTCRRADTSCDQGARGGIARQIGRPSVPKSAPGQYGFPIES